MILEKAKKDGQGKKISIMNHPEYRKQWDLLMNLRTRITEAEKALNEITNRYGELAKLMKETHQKALEETIQGGDPGPADFGKKLRDEAETLRSRIRGLRLAEWEQARRTQETRLKVSTDICKTLKPRDLELAHADAVGFIKWCQQRTVRIDFLRDLGDGDVAFSFEFVPMGTHYGDPREPHTSAALLLMEYVDRGYLEPEEIPKEWRESWYKISGITLKKVAV